MVKQIKENFGDPIIQKYLEDIITIARDRDGRIYLLKQGIVRGCAFSPFFRALYLKPLDRALGNKKEIFYVRHMDDVLIFARTKRQYTKVKKQLFQVLKQLKLKLSPHKTKMGQLAKKKRFHFLGVEFEESRNPQTKTQEIRLHARSYRRALDKVKALKGECRTSGDVSALPYPMGFLVASCNRGFETSDCK